MKSTTSTEETFDDNQILQTLRAAIATSKKTLMEDGILLILWGAGLSFSFFWVYYQASVLVASRIRDLISIISWIAGIALIVFTIYFLFFKNKKVYTNIAFSTRFVWIGIIIAHNLNVIITKKFIAEVDFELIFPLQMVLVGFALFVTGGIYRYYILSLSGIIMWIAAAISAGYDLNIQFLVAAITYMVCFVIPGTLMYKQSKKPANV